MIHSSSLLIAVLANELITPQDATAYLSPSVCATCSS